jgi:hypothetical protein
VYLRQVKKRETPLPPNNCPVIVASWNLGRKASLLVYGSVEVVEKISTWI